jgi:hypothetical protein
MKLFLGCELTQLNLSAKLISLALVAETGQEFYVEPRDTNSKTAAISSSSTCFHSLICNAMVPR